MMIERQLSIALVLFGGALVLPHAANAWHGNLAHYSFATLLTGDFLGGLGLLLLALMLLERGSPRLFLALNALLLAALTAGFAGGTLLVALRLSGHEAWWAAAAALPPLLGAGSGAWGALRR